MSRTLRVGDKGADVRAVQDVLNFQIRRLAALVVDGALRMRIGFLNALFPPFSHPFSFPTAPRTRQRRGGTQRSRCLNLSLDSGWMQAAICWAWTVQPKCVFPGAVYGLPLVARPFPSVP